jgi:hypothetical protein
MRVALFAAGVVLAVVILMILVKKDDSKPTKSVATASEGSARAAPVPSPAPKQSPTPAGSAGSAETSEEVTAARPETAVADAFAALTAGDAKNALAIAEQVLAREPDHKGMKKVAAMAACALGKVDVAQKYYDAVERGARSSIASVCQQKGIRLQASSKRPELETGRVRNRN